MSKLLLAVLGTALLTCTPPASAAEFTSSGKIVYLNSHSNVVYLNDGDAYQIPSDVDLTTLHLGARVNIGWNTQSPQTYLPLSTENLHVWLVQAENITLVD